MSIYEERLEHDLEEIREQTRRLGQLVTRAVQDSTDALRTGDKQLAYETILRDQIANRVAQSLDQLCHAFVVRHSPSAGHLRFVSSVLRINIALERIGDYAVTISRETVKLSQKPRERVLRDLELLVRPTIQALKQALDAFHDSNPELARGTRKMASEQGSAFDSAFADLVDQGEEGDVPVRDLFAELLVFNRLSRVCDQAKNICEETVFVALGETKSRKVFRILFVDKDGQASRMALAIAKKSHQDEADFSAASLAPHPEPRPDLQSFMASRGFDLRELDPAPLGKDERALSVFKVIIALEEGITDSIETVPYSTVALDWSLDRVEAAGDESKQYEAMYEAFSSRLDDLMKILAGSS